MTAPPGLPEPERPRRNESTHALVCELVDRVSNLESLFERLLSALDEEQAGEERPSVNLDGELQGGPRDQSASLG